MKDVRKKYGDFEFQMSLEIPDGRITGLVGKNGAGKSTAIKLLLGLVKPDAGEIRILESEGKELPVSIKQEIGHRWRSQDFVHSLRWMMQSISLRECIRHLTGNSSRGSVES